MARDLTRWEPTRELASMRGFMNRALEDWFYRPFEAFGLISGDTLAVDVYESDGHVVVETPMPGVKPEDIKVSVTGDTLTIKAETQKEDEVKEKNYLRRELRYGAYRRSMPLPAGLNTDEVEASYHDGILTLDFAKSEEAKAKSIKVKST
jgi:HSP20 family protein